MKASLAVIAILELAFIVVPFAAIPGEATMSECIPLTQPQSYDYKHYVLPSALVPLGQDTGTEVGSFSLSDGFDYTTEPPALVYYDWRGYDADAGKHNYLETGFYGTSCASIVFRFTECVTREIDVLICSQQLNLDDWVPLDGPFADGNCEGTLLSMSCGMATAECLSQQAFGVGVSDDPNTFWEFRAYNSYGNQLYTKTGTGLAFQAHAEWTVYWGEYNQVSSRLTADGVTMGSTQIGCA